MRESTNSCRSWRVSLNFLARLKNNFNKKVDKFFINTYFPEPTAPPAAAPPPPTHAAHGHGERWSTPGQCDNHEASGSNHTSTQNSQYFEAEDAPEYLRQHQLPRLEVPLLHVHGRSSSPPGMVPPSSGFHQDLGLYNSQHLEGDAMLVDHPHLPTSHDQDFLRGFDRQHLQAPMSVNEYDILFPGECAGIPEFSDAVTELQGDEPMSSWQGTSNCSQGHGAPSVSMQMSGDTVATEDSNMRDTGDSNFAYILPPHPEQQRRTIIKQYLERVQHILFEEELRLPGRRRFRVIANIVCAYRKLRELVRRKRMQGTSTTTASMSGQASGSGKMKRIRSAECRRVYQGIKKRKEKWVAEIRVSKMPDKVWLGSFQLEKEAALAYDAGLHHCSVKRTKIFNFKESPQKLGPSQYLSLLALCKEERKARVQSLANDHAMAYGSSNNIR